MEITTGLLIIADIICLIILIVLRIVLLVLRNGFRDKNKDEILLTRIEYYKKTCKKDDQGIPPVQNAGQVHSHMPEIMTNVKKYNMLPENQTAFFVIVFRVFRDINGDKILLTRIQYYKKTCKEDGTPPIQNADQVHSHMPEITNNVKIYNMLAKNETPDIIIVCRVFRDINGDENLLPQIHYYKKTCKEDDQGIPPVQNADQVHIHMPEITNNAKIYNMLAKNETPDIIIVCRVFRDINGDENLLPQIHYYKKTCKKDDQGTPPIQNVDQVPVIVTNVKKYNLVYDNETADFLNVCRDFRDANRDENLLPKIHNYQKTCKKDDQGTPPIQNADQVHIHMPEIMTNVKKCNMLPENETTEVRIEIPADNEQIPFRKRITSCLVESIIKYHCRIITFCLVTCFIISLFL